MKQTPESILKSFQNSGKKHLIITGERGCGKSSRLEVIRNILTVDMPGVITYAIPKNCVMLRDSESGNECKIGTYSVSQFKTNSMCPDKSGFENFAVPVVEALCNKDSQWAYIDEIGYLENEVEDYKDALRRLFNEKRVLAVLRKQDLSFVNEIKGRKDVFVVELDTYNPKIGCVIMASGMGKRFGGNKLLTSFNGKRIIENILDITECDLFEKRVVVTRSKEIAALCNERGIECILHELPGRNDTIRLGLEKMTDLDGCMFCPSDQPLLTKDSIKREVLSFSGISDEIVRLKWKEKSGMPVIFGTGYFKDLNTLPEGKGGNVIISANLEKIRYVEANNEWELFDVDTKEDLELIR